MSNSYRIRTTPGDSNNIVVNLQQDFDLLEILSLKFTQSEIYTRACADYGVVVGRVSSNHGFGISNARVSIFVPLSTEDEDNPIISTLYPYKSTADRNEDGYRYNLLPYVKSHSGHAPTGTFPDKKDVLYRDEVLEIYEKYYKYTVKTNNAGDFMIWGVPLGSHTIHVDVDMSDMGCFSVRPYDLMQQGVASLGKFKNQYEYKSSVDIDSLPQIIKFDKSIEVIPFWGNEDLCQIGITRTDFDFSELGISLQPTALFIGSMVTDAGHLAVKKNGKPRRHQGYKCKLETYEGEIEAIRFTGKKYKDDDGNYYPELERVNVEKIDDEGTWMCTLPMNLDYIITNEFGDEEFTNDPNKGVATSGSYRFRVNTNYEHRKMEVASYLIPNIREFTNRSDGKLDESNKDTRLSYTFSTDFDDYFRFKENGIVKHENTKIRDLILGTNNDGIPEDYFYKFTYNKVYSAASFHGSHFEGNFRDAFVGIKEIVPNEDHDCNGRANKLPVNFGFRNRISFQLILALVLLFFKFIIKVIHVRIVEIVGGLMYKVGKALDVWPVRRAAEKLQHTAFKWQEAAQLALPLTIYPVCEECGQEKTENENDINDIELGECIVASGKTTMAVFSSFIPVHRLIFTSSYYNEITPGIDCPNATGQPFVNLGTLHNEFVTNNPDEGSLSRYALAVFPITTLTGTTEEMAITQISNPGRFFQNSGGDFFIEFDSRDDLFDFMSEADTSIASGEKPTSPREYYFKIYDLDGTTINQLPQLGYEIESGCDKYDKFYDETLLHSQKFIWAVEDADYGSPEVTIEMQNQYVVTTGSTYGGGIFPAEVLRYVSYDENQRNIYITGLNSISNYDIELVGSKKQSTIVGNETTIYTIGTLSQSLITNNNTTNSITFNTIAPIHDKITIGISNGPNTLYNYINGLKITDNVGGDIIYINIYGGIDEYMNTQWNNFNVGIGPHNNLTLFNLKDTLGNITQVNIELTSSLNITSNNVISQFQKIFFKPTVLSGDTTSPYTPADYSIISSVAASGSGRPLPTSIIYKRIGRQIYHRETKSGFTEIRNGLIILVPTIIGKSISVSILKEWYYRNQVNTAFCGGVVNHSFIDNWLTGILYAFKFQFRKGQRNFIDGIINGRKFKYPRELVYYDTIADTFYYRSTPFDVNKNNFIGQKAYYAGRISREILRPTTITDLGPRDEFIDEICTDKRVDPNCSVIRDISTSSYQDIEEILEYTINYRLDISKTKVKIKDFFNRKLGRIQLFDGDIVQLESINCEAGIEEFDLDSPKYFMYNGELLDPEDPNFFTYFKDTVTNPIKYGPVPIDFKLDDNGRQVRLCLNHPDYLGESSQVVPFYLWDKKGEGFGSSKHIDEQEFKKDFIVAEKLQRIYSFDIPYDYIISGTSDLSLYTAQFNKKILVVSGGTLNNPTSGQLYVGNGVTWVSTSGYTKNSNYIYHNGTEEYLLYPMTKEHDILDININGPDSLERFDYISLTAADRNLYTNAPEGTLFMYVVSGTVDDPSSGLFYVMKNRSWVGPYTYNRNADDVFISPTANNYSGNLQVLSTPYLYYFGLKPGKTSFDRFINAFGPKDAFK